MSRNYTQQEKEEFKVRMIADQANRVSLTEMSKKYGVSRNCMARWFKEWGIELTTNSVRSEKRSDIWENPNTPDHWYWLGFIYGDGSLHSSRYQFSLKLGAVDKSHIQKFLDWIGLDRPIRDRSTELGSTCEIDFIDKQFYEGLISLGIVPRKSLIAHEFPVPPKEFEKDYIRGLLDSDGTLVIRNNKSLRWGFIGHHAACSYLKEYFGCGSIWKYPSDNELLYTFEASSSTPTPLFTIYNRTNTFLERKMKTFEEYCELYKTNFGAQIDKDGNGMLLCESCGNLFKHSSKIIKFYTCSTTCRERVYKRHRRAVLDRND